MLDDLLELVLDVGGELLFSRKKGEQGLSLIHISEPTRH